MIPALAIAASTLAILSDNEDDSAVADLIEKALLTRDRSALLDWISRDQELELIRQFEVSVRASQTLDELQKKLEFGYFFWPASSWADSGRGVIPSFGGRPVAVVYNSCRDGDLDEILHSLKRAEDKDRDVFSDESMMERFDFDGFIHGVLSWDKEFFLLEICQANEDDDDVYMMSKVSRQIPKKHVHGIDKEFWSEQRARLIRDLKAARDFLTKGDE